MKYAKLLILYVLICIIYVACDSKGTLEGSKNDDSVLSDKSEKVSETGNIDELANETNVTDKNNVTNNADGIIEKTDDPINSDELVNSDEPVDPDRNSTDTPQNAIKTFDAQIPDMISTQMSILLSGGEISLPENYSLLDYCEGDLNNDEIMDAAVAIEQAPGEYSGSRILYVFINDKGIYKLSNENNKILLGNQEGGVLGDPYSDITIKNGKLYVSDYGGSSLRWAHDYIFGYHDDEFILTNIIRADFNINEGLYTRYEYDLLEKKHEISEGEESSDDSDPMECVYIGGINISKDITFDTAYSFLEENLVIEDTQQ